MQLGMIGLGESYRSGHQADGCKPGDFDVVSDNCSISPRSWKLDKSRRFFVGLGQRKHHVSV